MYQIAIGDSLKGFTVLHGASIAAPGFKATVNFAFSSAEYVKESIDIQIKGTYAQINTFIALLNAIIQRAADYSIGFYPVAQQLRFVTMDGQPYYYATINQVYLESNPAGYLTQPTGSKLITLHYTRPNFFDGAAVLLPLSGRAGADVATPYPLFNHTDAGVNHGSTVLVKKTSFSTDLPAPLRIIYNPDTGGGATYRNIFMGAYHHETFDGDLPFFYYYNELVGGINTIDAAAISGGYKAITWTSLVWTQLILFNIPIASFQALYGYAYRPFVRLFATHAYTDLYFKIIIEHASTLVYETEPVYSPPGYGYFTLPPIDLPPNFTLNEVAPDTFNVSLYGFRESGAATAINIDCITLFPLCYAATFYGFHSLLEDQPLIDDNFKGRHNMRNSPDAGESVSHARQGSPLLLFPGQFNRLFFYTANATNLIPIAQESSVTVSYYPRVRLL